MVKHRITGNQGNKESMREDTKEEEAPPSPFVSKKAEEILQNDDIQLIDAARGNLHFLVKSQNGNGRYDVFRVKGMWSICTSGKKLVEGKQEAFCRDFNDANSSSYIYACKKWLEGIQ